MPSQSFGLHPQTLAGLRPPTRQPGNYTNLDLPSIPRPAFPTSPPPSSFAPMPNLPPDLSQPHGDPGMLVGLRSGGAMPPGGPAPFLGGQNPGAFGQPAPFNPFLAQALMARLGSMGMLGGGSAGIMPRGPLGSFGLTGPGERPKTKKNPYQ